MLIADRILIASLAAVLAISILAAFVVFRRTQKPFRAIRFGGIVLIGLGVFISVFIPGVATGAARKYQRRTLEIMDASANDLARSRVQGASTIQDAWGNPLLVSRRGEDTLVVSFGEGGKPDHPDPWSSVSEPSVLFTDDIVFLNGKCVRGPVWWRTGA